MDLYFTYLCDKALKRDKFKYSKLLTTLHNRRFEYSIPRDENREMDALEMRDSFFADIPETQKEEFFMTYENRPCSVLEMMVALIERCQGTVLGEDDTSDLFVLMITNMNLFSSTDKNFDSHAVNKRIDIMLNREYDSDGSGSMFYIPNCSEDMRTTEIWYQAMWYIDSIYNY